MKKTKSKQKSTSEKTKVTSRKTYDKDRKHKVILRIRSGDSLRKISRIHNIPRSTIWNWKQKMEKNQKVEKLQKH